MTEDEARTKWCPFYRTSGSAPADNRRGIIGEAGCIGSACMAWRWKPLMVDTAYLAAVTKAMATQPNHKAATAHVNANRAEYGLRTEPFDGYCGLANEQGPLP